MSDIFDEIDIPEDHQGENLYDSLVGEGKKFRTPEDLAKSKAESDRFIERLQREMEELRQEVKKSSTMDEILTKVRESMTPPQQHQPAHQPQNPTAPTDTPKIEEVVSGLLSKREQEQRLQKNRETVQSRLTERFGADAQIYLNKKAKELGVSLAELREIADKSPSVFFATVGLNQTQAPAPTPAPRSSQQAPSGNGSGTRDKAYYERLKATDKAKYFSAEVQKQMYKDWMANPSAFQ